MNSICAEATITPAVPGRREAAGDDGLEELLSDNYTTFMERSFINEPAMSPGRNNGILAFNWTETERATWAIGTFTNHTGFDQPPTFQFDHWGLDLAMRATYLPWYDEPSGGRGVFHTGLGYVYRSAPDHIQPFAARAESGFGPAVVNFTLTDTVNRTSGVTNNFYGTYAYVSYFLTGEHRPYNRKLGVFDRVRPYENFFRVRTGDGAVQTGRSAWEIAYRFSYMDMLDDLTVKGAGRVADHAIGLNWYMNPYARIMCNYVHSLDTFNVAAGTRISGGSLDIVEMRFAMDF